MHIDWREIQASGQPAAAVVDPRRRLRICLVLFIGLLAAVLARLVQLEASQGAAFRAAANTPLVRPLPVRGERGRILSHDGVVLACDCRQLALAVSYRYLQQPCDTAWLRLTARGRLAPAQRRDRQQVAAEEQRVLAERADLARRLAQLCGLTDEQWQHRAAQVQAGVERIAQAVRRQHEAQAGDGDPHGAADDSSATTSIGRWLADVLQGSVHEAAPLRTVKEERDYHVMVDDIPPAVVTEIETHRDRYPAVKIIPRYRRSYPRGTLAAHVLGYLGLRPPEDDPAADHAALDRLGVAGLERQYETLLAGSPGVLVEITDHAGHVTGSHRQREPGVGRDLVLTLDARLQAAAESLLDAALVRRGVTLAGQELPPAGGAIVVMDVESGALRALASAPRFDPRWFETADAPAIAAALHNPAHPLFDRAAAMALPPGSVFKIVTAVALLESAGLDPQEPLVCRGYLDDPEQWRCALYQHTGRGHGAVALADALAQSCNVYFFRHAREMGPAKLVDWALRLGLGRPTGVDLPGEAAGHVPVPNSGGGDAGRGWRPADTLALSIGQQTLTCTPLQMACLTAALVNGGRQVKPHLAQQACHPPQPIAGLHPETLAAIHSGLEKAVDDPAGTAYGAVHLDSIRIAGKTGTAQTGAGRPDHAWFAGYVPADHPRLAFVVVLEYAGEAATAAAPVARRLVEAMTNAEGGMLNAE